LLEIGVIIRRAILDEVTRFLTTVADVVRWRLRAKPVKPSTKLTTTTTTTTPATATAATPKTATTTPSRIVSPTARAAELSPAVTCGEGLR
jgi:hypothetical protein